MKEYLENLCSFIIGFGTATAILVGLYLRSKSLTNKKMNQYTTTIRAIDPHTGELVTWNGPVIPGRTFEDAEMYCHANGLGYCKVDGIYTGEQIFIENHQNN